MPVSLGILYHEYRSQGEPFGLETLHFRQLCEMGQVRGMKAFVLTPDSLFHGSHKLRGYVPDADGRWVSQPFSIPDVTYLRGVTMDASTDQRIMNGAAWLSTQGSKLLNSIELIKTLGDKWVTHLRLISHPIIGAHLPQTILLSDDGLREMLNRYPIIMIKHRHGFESRGMIRIASLPDGNYSCVVNDRDASRQRFTLHSLDALADQISRYTQPTQDFIVQQGIQLANLQGRPFEVRVILNKTRGAWLRTGMVTRLSGTADMPFLAVGSERNQRPSEVLPIVFGDRSVLVLDQVRSLARTIVTELERVAGPGGELALDFGFDEQGHPWLIEGNSKPFNLFIRIGAYSLRRKNMERVLEYAQQIAAKEENDAGVLR